MDANANRTSSLYDVRGQVYATQDPLGAYTTFVFDGVGNTTKRTDARNRVTTYTLDALNRTTGQLYPDSTRVTTTFDAAGRQITMQDVTGVTSYTYDANSQQTSVLYPIGKALTYSFDGVGNRTILLDASNGRTTYAYDAQNRLTSILNPYNERTTLTYDALDRELKKTLANGMALSHTYDAAGRETLLENRKSTGAALVVYTSTYDVVDNRLTVLELDGVRVTYAYDASYQLVNEQRSGASAYNVTYTYDGVGNRLTKQDSGQVTTSSYNAANALTLMQPPTGQPTTSSYDGNGNLTLENLGGARTTYTWDTENRLTRVQNSDGSQNNSVYRADGKRWKTDAVTAFLWDGENVLMELNPNLSPTAQYTDFPGYWGGLVSERVSGASSFYGFDPQASARILVSLGGVITDSYTYKAFGEELAVSGSTPNPHRYIGRFGYYRDIATRLSVRARVLRVDLGRWISRDPIGFGGGDWNLYGYVGNRAVIREDPSGLVEHEIPWFPGDPDFHKKDDQRCKDYDKGGGACEDAEYCIGLRIPWPNPGPGPRPGSIKVKPEDINTIKSACNLLNNYPRHPNDYGSHVGLYVTSAGPGCCRACYDGNGKAVSCSDPSCVKGRAWACITWYPGGGKKDFDKLPAILRLCVLQHEWRVAQSCYWTCRGEQGMMDDQKYGAAERRRQTDCIQKALNSNRTRGKDGRILQCSEL